MIDFKREISQKIAEAINIDYIEIEKGIETPREKNMGDYAFPCFRLAKTLKKAPQMIADEIKEKLDLSSSVIEKAEVVNRISKFLYKKRRTNKNSNRRI